jgi:hypothetical protein
MCRWAHGRNIAVVKWQATAALLLIATGLVTACGAGAHVPSNATREAATAAWRDVAQCFRDHGFPVPDPAIDDQGNATFPSDVPRTPDEVITACQTYLDRLPNQGGDQAPLAADIERRRQFAACMREHGVAAWPDPDADGRFPNTPELAAEGKTPTLVAARDACQHFLANGGTGG